MESQPEAAVIIKVDTSEVRVGAVLSQHFSEDNKFHPCAFFSWKLSAVERNYDMRKQELLVAKLALEEWRLQLLKLQCVTESGEIKTNNIK